MRIFSFPLFAALALYIALSWAVPVINSRTSPSALTLRGEHCYNAPDTIAGTPLTTRALPRHSRVLATDQVTQIWCAPGSSTYVIITWTGPIAAAAVNHLLSLAYGSISAHINAAGDSVVPAGFYRLAFEGVELLMQNTNNHQQTYGVINAAIAALAGFQVRGVLGPRAVNFQVYDGPNLVGVGYLKGYFGG